MGRYTDGPEPPPRLTRKTPPPSKRQNKGRTGQCKAARTSGSGKSPEVIQRASARQDEASPRHVTPQLQQTHVRGLILQAPDCPVGRGLHALAPWPVRGYPGRANLWRDALGRRWCDRSLQYWYRGSPAPGDFLRLLSDVLRERIARLSAILADIEREIHVADHRAARRPSGWQVPVDGVDQRGGWRRRVDKSAG